MTRRRKPFDPAASERRKAETRAEVERLEAMGAEVNLGSDGKILSSPSCCVPEPSTRTTTMPR
jgi:hypothetical protein